MASLDRILFGGSKTSNLPSLNVSPLKERLSEGVKRQMGIAQDTRTQLSPMTSAYQSSVKGRGQQFVGDVGNRGQQYLAQSVNPALRNAFRTQTAKENFAQVPALQQQLRSQLGGGGLTGNAAAVARLADPALDAARSTSSALTDYDLTQEANRQNVLKSIFGTDVGALESQFGTDLGAESTGLNLGREDLLREQGDISSLVGEETSGLNELDLLQQQADIERARAMAEEASRRSGARRSFYSTLAAQAIPALSGGFNALRSAFTTPSNVNLATAKDSQLQRLGLL